MNLLILAAGGGTRLRPFTENIPKCLFKLGRNATILSRAIDGFRRRGTARVCVVTGFMHDAVEQHTPDVEHVYNPFHGVTNSVASLWFAREYLDDDCVIINGDVVMEDALVGAIVEMDHPALVLIDSSRGAGADYKVATHEDHVVMMSKDLHTFTGEYVGVTKLDQESALLLRTEVDSMVHAGQTDEWYENALVRMVLNQDFNLGFVDIPQFHWTEVDTADDILAARKIYERDA